MSKEQTLMYEISQDDITKGGGGDKNMIKIQGDN